MRLECIEASEFNLQATLGSGQVFHWSLEGKGWQGLIGDTNVYVEQSGRHLKCAPGHAKKIARYFALDHPMEEIYASFPEHEFMQAAVESCRGIRIIRQPLWECVATFMTSPMKQVAHIRQMSLAIRAKFGSPVRNSTVNAYPTPEKIAALTEQALRECGLGFRAKNVLLAAQAIAEGRINLEAIAKLPTKEARESLCQIRGIGKKVANCILLFGYERLDAVPIDVWIARVLREVFLKKKRKLTLQKMEEFSATGLGNYAGYAQQYLFHHARVAKALRA